MLSDALPEWRAGRLDRLPGQRAGSPCVCSRGRYDDQAIVHFTTMIAPTPTIAARSRDTADPEPRIASAIGCRSRLQPNRAEKMNAVARIPNGAPTRSDRRPNLPRSVDPLARRLRANTQRRAVESVESQPLQTH